MTKWRPDPDTVEEWVPWVRAVAAPYALADAAIERFPAGHEPWAWVLAVGFTVGAIVLLVARGAPPAVALAFDLAAVSGFVCLYGFEPNSPVRGLFVLTALEGGLVAGRVGALAAAAASAPALAVFEWRSAGRIGDPFDAGHVLGPVGIELAVGLTVAVLAVRARELR